MRWCLLCGDQMIPEFASPCEDPVAWTCRACGFFQLETGGRPLAGEQLAAVRQLPGRAAGGETPLLHAAVGTAREILTTFGLTPPVDVERVASLLGYPVEWVRRPVSERGGIARRAGRETLVLNRAYPFHSAAERRWVVAEELGHAVLGHTALAASTAADVPATLREPTRTQEERAGKAFAAELLMPAAEVRAEFRRMQPRLRRAVGRRERAELLQEIVTGLAHAFQVPPAAMRRRLEDLGLLR